MTRRKIPAFPLHLLADHPAALALPAAGFGMLCRLIIHFWLTDCKPIPKNNDELSAIMRAHRPTMSGHKAQILQIFGDLRPQIEQHLKNYKTKQSTLLIVGQRGNATQQAQRAAQRVTDLPAAADPAALHPLRPVRQRNRSPAGTMPRSDSGSSSWSD
jgi:hypothetical protein